MLIADGLDDAILGVGSRCGQPDLVVYDESRIINILMERDGMSYSEALEFYEFNIKGSWVGDDTPIWLKGMDRDELAHYVEENG